MVAVLLFIFGVCVGSFINVVVLRLRGGESLTGRSRCLSCLRQLKWYHNLPLVSFGALRGRCAYCFKPISWQYPLVELASGLLWTFGYLWFVPATTILLPTPYSLLTVLMFGVFASLWLALFVYDVRWYELPDELTLPGIAVALAFNVVLGHQLAPLVLGTLVGAAFFGMQYLVSRGKWVGDGDIRAGALAGAMVGTVPMLGLTLLIAYVGGSVVGVTLLALRRKGWKSQLPFGAFLAPATLVTLLWGTALLHWYLGLLW